MAKRSVESYSELECLVLGLIALGATSGYAMRKSMQKMQGNRWSVDSGSIYRALRRLSRDGLVEETGRVGVPNRQRIEYRLHPTGDLVLQSWLQRIPDDAEMQMVSDPIRTRSYFLGLLDSAARQQTLKGWILQNKLVCDALKTSLSSQDETDLRAYALKSLLMQLEARHDWLKSLQAAIRRDDVAL